MDNVTHALIGYALGRGVADHRPRAERRAALWTSVLGSNAPDLDVVIAPFTEDAKLANLLHHRGHTHTLLLALPLGILCAAIFARVFGVSERAARQRLVALGALAGALHIGFDWLNNYGVHPFFPLDNRWYYGDAVFIIEPLLIALLAALPAVLGTNRATRMGGALIYAVLLGLLWLVKEVPAAAAIFSSAIGASALALHLRARHAGALHDARRLALGSLAASVLVIALFQASGAQARARFTAHFARIHPGEQAVDMVLTPSPGNPLCWSVLSVGREGELYRARMGALTLAPGLVSQAQCRFLPRADTTTAPLVRVATEGDVQLHLVFERPLSELRALHASSCEARLFMQFARAPFWIKGQREVLGDLRYDNERELSFAEIEPTGRCPNVGPAPWIPPRSELLGQ